VGEENPELFERRAEDHARAGDFAAAVALRERAFAAWRASGDVRRAAYLAAYQIAFDHHALFGNQAVAQGWLERGAHLAEAAGECAEAGWVALSRAVHTADPVVRASLVGEATRLAERCGDTELKFDALAYTGLMLVEDGRVSEGMRCLDEAAAAAARGGEVANPVVAGEIYCKLLVACERALDVRRAEEWLPVAAAFGDRPAVAWASAICRMHYGGVMVVAGRWEEAEHELAEAVRLYDASYRALRSSALVRLAELRVRQGRLGEARELLAGQTRDGYAVRPWARMEWLCAADATERAMVAARLERVLGEHTSGPLDVPVLGILTDMQVACGKFGGGDPDGQPHGRADHARSGRRSGGLCPTGHRLRRCCLHRRERQRCRGRPQRPGGRDRRLHRGPTAAGGGRGL
jgi:tetratricopeptide (TPR) repeat protein